MIGHRVARAYLERQLPTATLLYGPASVGKWTLASHLAEHHQVRAVDRWQVPHGLTIDTVRLVTQYAAVAPFGEFKLIQARLDAASRPALHALLKTLEEPPPKVKFLLTSSSTTMPTVASRCTVFELGMLPAGELEQIYRTQGYASTKAHAAAVFARGQVARGYQYDAATDRYKHQVLNVIKALALRDRDLFNAAFIQWDGRSSDMLAGFLTECLTQRWSTFTEADAFELHHDRPLLWKLVAALGKLRAARPRLGVRAALEPFLNRR